MLNSKSDFILEYNESKEKEMIYTLFIKKERLEKRELIEISKLL
jgi:hypothetical protein